MANTYTDIIPKILGQGLSLLQGRLILPRLVNRDYDGAAMEQGQTVNVPIPPTVTTAAVTPAATAPNPANMTFATTPVELSYHEEAPFQMGDKEQREVMEGAQSMAIRSAISSLATRINATILTAMDVGAGAATGTAGTAPFATLALAEEPMTLLDEHLIDSMDRRVVMNARAKANLLALPGFTSRDFVNDMSALQGGTFTGQEQLGASWWQTETIPTHTPGTGATIVTAATASVGDTSIAVDGGTGTILVGDVIKMENDDDNLYVVTGVSGNATSGTITIGSPGFKVAVGDGDTVTIQASHKSNFAFNRESVVFATRPFGGSSANSVTMDQMTDPETGVTLRVEVTREYKRDRWSFDALWGTKVIRSDGVVKILG